MNMSCEIERKFLVKGDFKKNVVSSTRIVQGYLSSVPERSVRIRMMGTKGFVTVKGIGDKSGVSRFEWEKEISALETESLLKICEPGIIDKTRHIVPVGKHTFEVDVFHGENEGLIIAEVELESEDEQFEKPEWLGKEVTGDIKYYNVMLKKKPFSKW